MGCKIVEWDTKLNKKEEKYTTGKEAHILLLQLFVFHLFQSREVFSFQFVQLFVDVSQHVFDSRDGHVLQGIHATVRHLATIKQEQEKEHEQEEEEDTRERA